MLDEGEKTANFIWIILFFILYEKHLFYYSTELNSFLQIFEVNIKDFLPDRANTTAGLLQKESLFFQLIFAHCPLIMILTNSANSHKRLIIIALLMAYIAFNFWGGSRYPALNDKATMGSETRLEDSLSFEVLLETQEGDSALKRIAYSTVNWVNTNKQGMPFGVLFAGAFLTFLSMLRRRSFKGRYANDLLACVDSVPLWCSVNTAVAIAKVV